MSIFNASLTLTGANGKQKRFKLVTQDISGADLGAELLTAQGYFQSTAGLLAAVSDAAISNLVISYHDDSVDTAMTGSADVFEYANVVLYLDDKGDKTVNLRIPAPSIGIFLGTTGEARDLVDIADTDLVDFIAEISMYYTVSDGETVDTTINEGIKGGVRHASL